MVTPRRWTEIQKNDFNLNISRYISTAVAEEEINLHTLNLHTLNAELVLLDQKIREPRDLHNAFLKELNLPLFP